MAESESGLRQRTEGRLSVLSGIITSASAATNATGHGMSACAAAESTDDYPIPYRIIVTACTTEQLLAAARHYARA